MCFKAVSDGACDDKCQSSYNFDITKQAYQLEFKNTCGMYALCKLCDKSQCKGCLVPYSDETVED